MMIILLVMHLIFEEVFLIYLYIFLIFLYRLALFFKIKNYFEIISLICTTLHDKFFFILFYSSNLMCISISIII